MLLRSEARRKAEHSPLLALPPELVTHIIRFLPLADRKTFSQVCRRFCALARSPQAGLVKLSILRTNGIWNFFSDEYRKSITEHKICNLSELQSWGAAIGTVLLDIDELAKMPDRNNETLLALCREFSSLPNVDTLDVKWHEGTDEVWEEMFMLTIAAVGGRLKCLSFIGASEDEAKARVVSRCIAAIWEQCTRVEALQISMDRLSDYHPLDARSTIKELDISSAYDETLQMFISACPNLERVAVFSLDFRTCMDLLQTCTKITHVSVSAFNQSGGAVELPYFPNLEVIEVDTDQEVDVTSLAGCTRLRKISLDCIGVSAGFNALPAFLTKQLDSFEIRVKVFLPPLPVGTLIFSFLSASKHAIKSVSLSGVCVNLDSLASLPALTTLVMKNCFYATTPDADEGSCVLSVDQFPRLSTVEIADKYGTGNLTGIHAATEHHHLKYVGLYNCADLHDVSFLARCSTLHDLSIRSCRKLDINTIRPPPSLVRLSVFGVGGTTLFPINQPFLSKIDIYECQKLCSLGDTPPHAPALTSIDIAHCPELCDISILARIPTVKSLTLMQSDKVRSLECLRGHPGLRRVFVFAPNLSLMPLAECPNINVGSVEFAREIASAKRVLKRQKGHVEALERAIKKRKG